MSPLRNTAFRVFLLVFFWQFHGSHVDQDERLEVRQQESVIGLEFGFADFR